MNFESTEIALLVIQVLEALEIPYLIGGSLASSIHGASRSTLDTDLVADLQFGQVPSFVQQLQAEFYISSDAVVEAIQERRSFNAIHLDSMFKIDIFLPKDRPFDRAQFANATPAIIATEPDRFAFVASPEDTVLAKLEWYDKGGRVSDRQWQDIAGILRVQGDRLDREYLYTMAASLNVVDLLTQALQENTD